MIDKFGVPLQRGDKVIYTVNSGAFRIAVVLGWSSNGRFIALWNLESNKYMTKTLSRHCIQANCLSFSPTVRKNYEDDKWRLWISKTVQSIYQIMAI